MKEGDTILFDHMGREYRGVILEIKSTKINRKKHRIVTVKSDIHRLALDINITMFPHRVRSEG